MIIPLVSANDCNAPAGDLRELIAWIRRWSLFGTVALSDIGSFNQSQQEMLVQAVAGFVDLEILWDTDENQNNDQLTGEQLLGLLNAGANAIVSNPDRLSELAEVPEDRQRILKSENDSGLAESDRIFLANPTTGQLSRLEQQRVDVLVPARTLDASPQMMADFFQAVLISDRPDGLWPTLIVDSLGMALGLAYSNYESLLDAITHRRGTYWSRSRNELWVKGLTSGATQELLGIRLDCDRDCLRLMVRQEPPGFCHRETHSCFGSERTMATVMHRLRERIESTDEKSFTKKLISEPKMLEKKLLEEARELSEAVTSEEVAFEAADVLYFSLVKMLGAGVKLETVHQELARRMNRVVRRPPGIKS